MSRLNEAQKALLHAQLQHEHPRFFAHLERDLAFWRSMCEADPSLGEVVWYSPESEGFWRDVGGGVEQFMVAR